MPETEQNSPDKPKKRERLPQLQRSFIGEDATFIELNRTVRTIFAKHQPDFVVLDPTLDAAFLAGWLVLIETCENHITDETMLDIQRETTTAFEQHLNTALQKVDDLEFYVKKAFPANPALWQEFGFKKRGTIGASPSHAILWLFTMLRVIDDYETQLLAAGMPASFKTEYDTACSNTAEAELQQEYTKRLRLRNTRQRVEQLNRLHQYLQRVQNAARVIYRNDEVKRKQYM